MRPLGNYFKKKQNFIDKSWNIQERIKSLATDFLNEKMSGANIKPAIEMIYSTKESTLIISTKSKIIANELLFLLGDLQDHLIKNGISLNRIIIR